MKGESGDRWYGRAGFEEVCTNLSLDFSHGLDAALRLRGRHSFRFCTRLQRHGGDSAVADRDETDGADIQPPALKDRAKLIPPLTRRPAAELRDDACANPSNVLRRRGRWHPAYPALKVLG